MPKSATASDLPLNDIFVPQKAPLSKISDDVIAYDLWFAPLPIKNPGYADAVHCALLARLVSAIRLGELPKLRQCLLFHVFFFIMLVVL